jgi:hypothetical protein
MGVASSNGHTSGETLEREAFCRDIDYLAGELPHRGGITENERKAAEYIARRFAEHTPLTQIEDFYSIEAYPYLFSMYYAEFFFVAILSLFWPWVALTYGVVVFLLYLAEFTGYSTMSRFLPQFETQNVTARIPCAGAQRLIVVTAHYDSPRAYSWIEGRRAGQVRGLHIALVIAMLLVLVSCGAQGIGTFTGAFRPDLLVSAAAVGILLAGAWVLFTGARRAPFTRGANNNASGVGVLLALAQRFSARPLASSEVLLVATGAKETWLSGMRQLFRGLRQEKSSAYFVNVAGIGAGQLRYVSGEGMLYVYSAGPRLLEAAHAIAPEHAARPMVWRSLPTDALVPMSRGFEAISIVATGAEDMPVAWNRASDTTGEVDLIALGHGANFVESLIRRLDADTRAS